MSKIWNESYKVHTYELDRQQKVSIRSICSFLIDTAGHHVQELGYTIPQLLEQNRSWFFSRFLIRMREYPGWREKISVETWPSGSQKLLSVRDWRLFSGQRLIGQATSGWLMIDMLKRRPLRPESYPEWGTFIHPERTIPHVFGKLPALDPESTPTAKQEFTVRFNDVDINGHANYLSYLEWILEGIPPEVRVEEEIAEMEIHFLSEANFAENITTSCLRNGETDIFPVSDRDAGSPKGTEYHHNLVRRHDGIEVARARTVWRPVA
jgi:acyl-ACP thioesterase